jgi:hypothetical protein
MLKKPEGIFIASIPVSAFIERVRLPSSSI